MNCPAAGNGVLIRDVNHIGFLITKEKGHPSSASFLNISRLLYTFTQANLPIRR